MRSRTQGRRVRFAEPALQFGGPDTVRPTILGGGAEEPPYDPTVLGQLIEHGQMTIMVTWLGPQT